MSQISTIAEISRQWFNKLVDQGSVPGVFRKANKRLEVLDEKSALEWAHGFRRRRNTKKKERQKKRSLPLLEQYILSEALKPYLFPNGPAGNDIEFFERLRISMSLTTVSRWINRARSAEGRAQRTRVFLFHMRPDAFGDSSVNEISRTFKNGVSRQALTTSWQRFAKRHDVSPDGIAASFTGFLKQCDREQAKQGRTTDYTATLRNMAGL